MMITAMALLALTACKQEKKQGTKEEEPLAKVPTAPYAEISVKEGGIWQDGPRGHMEYVGGTFKSVKDMEIPPQHTDHTWYIRYEGPGWENAQVGYRLYLDWRNAIDIFGKKVDSLVLPYVGQDGFDSYHEMADWGMDILKAGRSMGIGGFGRLVQDSVIHFQKVGNTRASVSHDQAKATVNIRYTDWETAGETTDLSAALSIYPGDRFTKVGLKTSTALEGLCTGLVKFDHVPMVTKTSKGGQWAYIATYGNQTLVDETDQLGMALFYRVDQVDSLVQGKHDHLVVFKPSTSEVDYYFLGAWEQEPDGLATAADFFGDLDEKLGQLDQKGRLE